MVRSTAHLLIVMMLLASGRLLACGWECADELAVPAEASCHQESAPATGITADGMHACLPDIAEPDVTVAKLVNNQLLLAAPVVTMLPHGLAVDPASGGHQRLRPRVESPHLPGFSVLRI